MVSALGNMTTVNNLLGIVWKKFTIVFHLFTFLLEKNDSYGNNMIKIVKNWKYRQEKTYTKL